MITVIVFAVGVVYVFFFFKQKTAYEMRISDWSSDVCSSDLVRPRALRPGGDRRGAPVGVPEVPGDLRLLRLPTRGPHGDAAGGDRPEHLRAVRPRDRRTDRRLRQIGRATCRERVCQYV